MKEKQIEKAIVNYLKTLWAIVETQNGWSIMIKKGQYNHKMTLQTKWCPDILVYYKDNFVWIEVKKNEAEVDKWIKLRFRHDSWETLPKSYWRELDQIKYRERILENWGTFIITWEMEEIVDYFINL